MKKVILAALVGATYLFSHVQADDSTATAKTYTLKVKATANAKILKSPSSKGSLLGTLKKGEKLDAIYYAEKNSYYKVKYKGKTAYILSKYVKSVSQPGTFVGHYFERSTAGSAGYSNLYVYKQTSKKINYVVYNAYKNGSGIYAPYNYDKYTGSAKLLSSKTAQVNINGCKGKLTLAGNTIKPSTSSHCYNNYAFTSIVPEYGLFQKVDW